MPASQRRQRADRRDQRRPRAWASARAVAIPTRRPVNVPGPDPDRDPLDPLPAAGPLARRLDLGRAASAAWRGPPVVAGPARRSPTSSPPIVDRDRRVGGRRVEAEDAAGAVIGRQTRRSDPVDDQEVRQMKLERSQASDAATLGRARDRRPRRALGAAAATTTTTRPRDDIREEIEQAGEDAQDEAEQLSEDIAGGRRGDRRRRAGGGRGHQGRGRGDSRTTSSDDRRRAATTHDQLDERRGRLTRLLSGRDLDLAPVAAGVADRRRRPATRTPGGELELRRPLGPLDEGDRVRASGSRRAGPAPRRRVPRAGRGRGARPEPRAPR